MNHSSPRWACSSGAAALLLIALAACGTSNNDEQTSTSSGGSAASCAPPAGSGGKSAAGSGGAGGQGGKPSPGGQGGSAQAGSPQAGQGGSAGHAGSAQPGGAGGSGPSGAGGSGPSGAGGEGPSGAGGEGPSGAGGEGPSGAGGEGQAGSEQGGGAAGGGGGPVQGPPGWKLVWSDEFDAPDGSPVDSNRWAQEEGGHGWGNNEREFYTKGTENAVQQGGQLVITARKLDNSDRDCWYGKCQYTSARLKTQGLYTHTYGRFSARIKVPAGQGIWPAFWMLGADIPQAGWPGCGEIDIMEFVGKDPNHAYGTIHGPGYSGASGISANWQTQGGALSDDFHEFTAEWEPGKIRFLVDEQPYATRTPGDLPQGTAWVYDHDFFLLLNLAVGGFWPGDPNGSTPFPAEMRVDWVRVYEKD